jgi:hypothetical protein
VSLPPPSTESTSLAIAPVNPDGAPSRFYELTRSEPVDRTSKAQLRPDSEVTLREELEVPNPREFYILLNQDWIAKNILEYVAAVLEPMVTSGPASVDVDDARHHSTMKYVIQRAIRAVQTGSERYTGPTVSKSSWTLDDHDTRFIAQIVIDGCKPGNWWESKAHDEHLPRLCAISHRLMSWLRRQYGLTRSTNARVRWEKKRAFVWVKFFNHLRRKQATATTSVIRPTSPGQYHHPLIDLTRPESPMEHELASGAFSPTTSLRPPPDSPFSATSLEPACPSTSSPETFVTAPSSPCHSMETALQTLNQPLWFTSQGRDDKSNDHTTHVVRTQGRRAGDHLIRQPTMGNFVRPSSIPMLPSYAVKKSRKTPGQLQGIFWMTVSGRVNFERKQTTKLAAWGVRPEHQDTCILIPDIWNAVDPRDIVMDFEYKSCPPDGGQRLVSASLPRAHWLLLIPSTDGFNG